MHIIDFTIYKSTGVRIEYPTPLAQALHDLDKANRAAEECIAMFRPKLKDKFKSWFPDGAA